jgi:hypothetical protein
MYKFTQRFFHFVAIQIAVIIVHVTRILSGDIEKKSRCLVYNKQWRPTLSGKGPHPLLWARSGAARGKITHCGTPNLLNCHFNSIYINYKCGYG